MKNTIAVLTLTGVAFISTCSFTLKPIGQDDSIVPMESTVNTANAKDLDVSMILNNMGISTKVDEKAIDAAYPAVKLDVATGKGVKFDFNNPMAQPYSLDVFDTDGNLIATVNNIISPAVALPSSMFAEGSYIYKLTGDGNTFAGKFYY